MRRCLGSLAGRLLPGVALLFLAACGQPKLDLRQQPPPQLSLELSLPETADQAEQKRAYAAAFREHFGAGLAPEATPDPAGSLHLLVVISQRTVRSEAEDLRNRTVDQATAVASASPLRMLHSALGPKSAYEGQVERLGYRPAALTGLVVLTLPGKAGAQESLKLEPMAVMKRMQPLGETDRTPEGFLLEEARAVALETRALLQKKFGWAPPAP